MKRLFFLLLMLPVIAAAQSKADYETVMRKFMAYYNNNDVDNVCSLFPEEKNSKHPCFWREVSGGETIKEYGKIVSFKYLGVVTQDPEKVTVFKVVYEKAGTKAMSFTLIENNKFGTFRFDTGDDEIDEMLKKAE